MGEKNPFAVLGLGFSDFYDGMANNVSSVLERHKEWKDISQKVKQLSEEKQNAIVKLSMYADDDREFFKFAGLEYAKGSPCGCGIRIAIADYVLRY